MLDTVVESSASGVPIDHAGGRTVVEPETTTTYPAVSIDAILRRTPGVYFLPENGNDSRISIGVRGSDPRRFARTTVLIDLDHPEAARVIHEEVGGLSRVTPDPTGGAYVTGYIGRWMHFVRADGGFRFDVLDQEGADSGLRGCVLGRFPVTGDTARMIVFGFHELCRALVPHSGVMDPVTLYVDVDRGHTIDAADRVPGNDADEILVGGYSKRITMLVPHRVHDR